WPQFDELLMRVLRDPPGTLNETDVAEQAERAGEIALSLCFRARAAAAWGLAGAQWRALERGDRLQRLIDRASELSPSP
ncbi:MAG: hypothetical protein AAFV53_27080, partial [Myxococcota bacterium]